LAKGERKTSYLCQGRFRVIRLLGRGTLGQVYEVEDEGEGRRVALKLLKGLTVPEAEQAARVMMRCAHPGLPQIYECGADISCGSYFTTELIDGEPLDRVLRSKQTDVMTAALLLADVLGHLDYLHTQGYFHGDIKPGNILVRRAGEVPPPARTMLLDYGFGDVLARQVAGGRMRGLGQTLLYASPEFIAGRRLDERTDLYSLGLLAYHGLIDRSPGEGQRSGSELLGERLALDIPPLSIMRHDAPIWLCDLVHRLTAQDRSLRFGCATDAIEAIRLGLGLPRDHSSHGARRLNQPVWVGRDRELAVLRDAVSKAAEGRLHLAAQGAADSLPASGTGRDLPILWRYARPLQRREPGQWHYGCGGRAGEKGVHIR
jgi:serine/threonine protein kinase